MSKSTMPKIAARDEAWEQGTLGREEAFVKRVAITPEQRAKLDSKIQMQAISIRMPDELITDLKAIAKMNGLGYQPLMRQVLTRFAHAELKAYARDAMAVKPKETVPSAPQVEEEKPSQRQTASRPRKAA